MYTVHSSDWCGRRVSWFAPGDQDAAMPPPSADHTCMEDGDPHPSGCPEDAEFFECRPDTADMEEAIALDVWARQAQPGWSLSGGDCSQEKC